LDGIPGRYRDASIPSFWEWWQGRHPVSTISTIIGEAYEELMGYYDNRSAGGHNGRIKTLEGTTHCVASADDELAIANLNSQLDLIIHKCGLISKAGGQMCWRDLKPAQEPAGYRSILSWANKNEIRSSDSWWIYGEPSSGRSTLAAAVLKTWCEHFGKSGLFVSVRSLGLELKDMRNFRNPDFLSELDRMAPLLNAPILVLDDFDRADNSQRMAQYLAQLLDHRYNEELPTIITSSYGADVLKFKNASENIGDTKNNHPLVNLDDQSLLSRLHASKRVMLRPTISTLVGPLKSSRMKSMDEFYINKVKLPHML
jgi:DNA replication protein DnaC